MTGDSVVMENKSTDLRVTVVFRMMKAIPTLLYLLLATSPLLAQEAPPATEPRVIPSAEFREVKLSEAGAFLTAEGNVNVVVAPDLQDLVVTNVKFQNATAATILNSLAVVDGRFAISSSRPNGEALTIVVLPRKPDEAGARETHAFNLRPVYFAMLADQERYAGETGSESVESLNPKQVLEAVLETCEQALLMAGDPTSPAPTFRAQRDTMVLLVAGTPAQMETVGSVIDAIAQSAPRKADGADRRVRIITAEEE